MAKQPTGFKTLLNSDALNMTFLALSDPTRRNILNMLADGQKNVSDLAKPFKMSLPAITKHLNVLERAGLISRSREAQWRPCKLEPARLEEAFDWISHYKSAWEESFDRLENYLAELQKENKSIKSKRIKHGKKI